MAEVPPLTMSFAPYGDQLAAALDCESQVFYDAYGNTREQWLDEYGPYDDASVFIAISEPGGDVVAACRLIVPSDAGLKTLDDVSRAPWQVDGYASARAAGVDPARALDIATIGVRRRMRSAGRLAWLALGHGATVVSRVNSLPHFVMIMDRRARRMMTSVGCDTFALPGTRPGPYLGSEESIPLWTNVAQMLDNQRRENPEGYRLVGQGLGFDGIRIPPQSDFVVPARIPVAVSAEPELV